MKAEYDSVAPDKTKWTNFLKQMFAFADVPFNVGDSNITKITAPVLIISGDNDGTDKIELMKHTNCWEVEFRQTFNQCQNHN